MNFQVEIDSYLARLQLETPIKFDLILYETLFKIYSQRQDLSKLSELKSDMFDMGLTPSVKIFNFQLEATLNQPHRSVHKILQEMKNFQLEPNLKTREILRSHRVRESRVVEVRGVSMGNQLENQLEFFNLHLFKLTKKNRKGGRRRSVAAHS